MRRFFILISILFSTENAAAEEVTRSAYDFSFKTITGEPLSLSDFRGKVLLVVNTASQCGFTGQYEGLQTIWTKYRDKGFVVLGVPSNDFGNQEPRPESEIKKFCEVNFHVDFPMTTKVKVSGGNPHPFYGWTAKKLGVLAKPRWNFHKYLIDTNGRLVDWFSTPTSPTSRKVINAIEKHLAHRPSKNSWLKSLN